VHLQNKQTKKPTTKRTVCKGRKMNNFTVDGSGQYYLSQVFKVNWEPSLLSKTVLKRRKKRKSKEGRQQQEVVKRASEDQPHFRWSSDPWDFEGLKETVGAARGHSPVTAHPIALPSAIPPGS